MNINDSNNSSESLSISISSKETSKLIPDQLNKTPINNVVKIQNENSELSQKSINRNKCPTCHGKLNSLYKRNIFWQFFFIFHFILKIGTGRIIKDEEHKLVALIPLDDNRLKPKRIWLWITTTVRSHLRLFFSRCPT